MEGKHHWLALPAPYKAWVLCTHLSLVQLWSVGNPPVLQVLGSHAWDSIPVLA